MPAALSYANRASAIVRGNARAKAFLRLAAALLAGGAGLLPGAGIAADHTGTVQVEGQTRRFIVHLPDGAPPNGGFALVLAFHGGGMQGAGMARITGMNAVADSRRFIAVYPDGVDHHWNDGRSTIRNPRNDVGFVVALIDQLERHYRIDGARVYATGISNGALFTERLACELSTRIAAIAPVAGTLPAEIAGTCRPRERVAVLQIDGTADPVMPYDGGAVKDFGGRGEGGNVASVARTSDFWARRNGCAGAGAGEALPRIAPGDPTWIRRVRYAACPAGGQVTLLSVIGGGHAWPGGAQPVRPSITGRPSRQVDASATIADFFLAQPTR